MDYVEKDYKRDLVGAMKYMGMDVETHEDKRNNFIPDMSFASKGRDGWIEVKYKPVPPNVLNDLAHWTRGQEEWLRSRGETGSGHCYLLLGTISYHYLWKWDALDMVRHLPFKEAVRWANVMGSMRDAVSKLDFLTRTP